MIWGIYLFVINIISFMVMGVDKKRAIKRKNRVRERTLFIFAFIGGSIGIYGGMKYYRHKTKHQSFRVGIPLVIIFQIGLLYVLTK